MKRVIELIVMASTLAAIVSTFFLYRSHVFSPQLTASLILADTPDESEAVTKVMFSETASSTPSYEPTPQKPSEKTDISENKENSIIIEKLPITINEIETLTAQIHSLTNLSRSQNNLPTFTLDTSLSAIAKKRSDEMIQKNYFSHTSPSGCDISCQIEGAKYQTKVWGENLALTNDYHLYTTTELAQTFIENWLKSYTHRDNILSKKFTHHGIGIASEGERIIITVVFAAP
ncbi:MAG: CAP domain-containing protein [Candidatus Pacebacteria bacterium]|nr:CAP domain-containing protein [Candidatus Paceibacterota bacterium]MBP9842602.1 CAP domain-containing protein [Candidatus Paceibacterota bacterium]